MLSLYNVLAIEQSHRLSNLQRSFLCYHTNILMLLLVVFLGPLKQQKKMSAPTRNFIISFFQALEQIHLLWLLLAEKYVTGCFYVCFCFYPSLLQLIFPSGVTKATTNIFFFTSKNSYSIYQS